MEVDYSKEGAPAEYKCRKCGVNGVKLWVMSLDRLSVSSLLCKKCMEEERITDFYFPAVPGNDPEENRYWTKFYFPEDGLEWWERLPLTITKS